MSTSGRRQTLTKKKIMRRQNNNKDCGSAKSYHKFAVAEHLLQFCGCGIEFKFAVAEHLLQFCGCGIEFKFAVVPSSGYCGVLTAACSRPAVLKLFEGNNTCP